jgi:nucleotide-binding universal stress UspA family protein
MRLAPKKILVPLALDGDDERKLAEASVEAACDLGKAFGAQLVFCHAAPPPVPVVGPDLSGETLKVLSQVIEERIDAAKSSMKLFEEKAKSMGVDARSVVRGDPDGVPRVICSIAEDEGVDLIAMCSHGRMGITRVILGSVAERVAHLAHVPVLLLKEPAKKD